MKVDILIQLRKLKINGKNFHKPKGTLLNSTPDFTIKEIYQFFEILANDIKTKSFKKYC